MVIGGIIIIAFFYFLFQLIPRRQEQAAQLSAGEVLDQRYARGEISKDEYLERKKHLSE
ncbi:MAG: SHOCT domain-containing protein [Halobacteriota archaeon]